MAEDTILPADQEVDSLRFVDVAALYGTYRPSYPNELIEDIVIISGIRPEGQILERGSGSGKHHFTQHMKLLPPDIYVTKDMIIYLSFAHLKRASDRMSLTVRADAFALNLTLNKGKGAFWHGDECVVVMGDAGNPCRRTVYYPYTNMPTTGEVILHDPQGESNIMQETGKTWFDPQWGPYALINANTNWEWFLLRFFDIEEAMLFAFPQCPYYDGTYISEGGERCLVRDYTITPKGFTKAAGMTFSKGWDLVMPRVMEERYGIRPLTNGQLNLDYLEHIHTWGSIRGKGWNHPCSCSTCLLKIIKVASSRPGFGSILPSWRVMLYIPQFEDKK